MGWTPSIWSRKKSSKEAEVMTGDGKVSTRVQWTGKLDAREYQLLPMPKVSKKQQKLLDGWLSSQVK